MIQSELWVTGGLSVERIEEIFVLNFGSTAPPAFTGRFYFDHGSSGGEVSGVKSSKDWTSLTGGRAVAAAGSFCFLCVVAYLRRYLLLSLTAGGREVLEAPKSARVLRLDLTRHEAKKAGDPSLDSSILWYPSARCEG